ncbi:hypothetical protein llap_10720 [Limosa lapponica baueri]|uniref:Uncharacterized protein n=1 Tax=Limosa lapponica baueri TaxID=1758121 RepID=A0A2I0TYT2_LIMLA|nr:hypothetical protein llap_10720 [Limosa lapponica baueri]
MFSRGPYQPQLLAQQQSKQLVPEARAEKSLAKPAKIRMQESGEGVTAAEIQAKGKILSQSSRNATESSKEKERETQAQNVAAAQTILLILSYTDISPLMSTGSMPILVSCYTAGKPPGPNLLSVSLTCCYNIPFADPAWLVWDFSLLQNVQAGCTLLW